MISVELKVSELQALHACSEGIVFFKKHANQRGTLRVEWTLDEQLKWLKLEARFTTWAMRQNLVPMLSMALADLRGADLYGADLHGAKSHIAYPGWKLVEGILVKE